MKARTAQDPARRRREREAQGSGADLPGRRGVTREEAAAWAAEFPALGEKGAYFFSLNRYLFVADKPRAP